MIAASRAIAYLFLAIGVAILAETIWLGGGQVRLPGGRRSSSSSARSACAPCRP